MEHISQAFTPGLLKNSIVIAAGPFGLSSRFVVIAAAAVVVLAIVIVFVMVLRSDTSGDSKTARGLALDADEGPAGQGFSPRANAASPVVADWNGAPAPSRAGSGFGGDPQHRPGDFGGTVGGNNAGFSGPPSRPQAPNANWGRAPGGWGEDAPAAGGNGAWNKAADPAWGAPPQADLGRGAAAPQRPGAPNQPANPGWGQAPGRTPNQPDAAPGNWGEAPVAPAWNDQQPGWGAPPTPQRPAANAAWGMPANEAAPQSQDRWGMPANEPAPQGQDRWGMPANEPAPQGQDRWGMPANEPAPQGQDRWGMPANEPAPQGQDRWGMPANEAPVAWQAGAPATPQAPAWGAPVAPQAPQAPSWGGAPPAHDPAADAWQASAQAAPPASARPDTRTAFIIIREGKEPGRTFELRKERMSIGRSRESEIFLEDLAVSRLHASIYRDDQGSYMLRDENSANGTTVNGQRVNEHRLVEGDEVQVGQTTMTFTRR